MVEEKQLVHKCFFLWCVWSVNIDFSQLIMNLASFLLVRKFHSITELTRKIKKNCGQKSIYNHKKLINHNSRSIWIGNNLVHLNHVCNIYVQHDFTEHRLEDWSYLKETIKSNCTCIHSSILFSKAYFEATRQSSYHNSRVSKRVEDSVRYDGLNNLIDESTKTQCCLCCKTVQTKCLKCGVNLQD